MPEDIFSLRPPILLPRPGIVIRRVRKMFYRENSTADEALLESVLERFGFSPVEKVRKLEGSVRNEIWLAEGPFGKKVVKRYKLSLSLQQIIYEHSIIAHLTLKNFNSVRLAQTVGGETLVEMEGRFYAVLDYLEGYLQFHHYLTLPGQNAQFLSAQGRALGRLHRALDGYIPQGDTPYGVSLKDYGRGIGLDWYLDTFQSTLEQALSNPAVQNEPVCQEVLRRADWIERQVKGINQNLEQSPLRRGTIHGDYGTHNLLFRPGCPVMVLDFELARRDWLLVDLVSALSQSSSVQTFDLAGILPLLAAYHAVYPHDAESYHLLPQFWQFQVLRRLMVSWSEYVQKGSLPRLEEARKRLKRLDWLLRYEEALSGLDQYLEKTKIALDMRG